MGTVFRRKTSPTWYIAWRGADGRRRQRATTARTKTEARRLLTEIERKVERQRMGLEPLDASPEGWTVADLLQWWLATYSVHTASHAKNASAIRKNIIEQPIGEVPMRQLDAGTIERHLQSRAGELAPRTLNGIRQQIYGAYSAAQEAGYWTGPNPAAKVRRRKIPRRLPSYLQAHEAHAVIEAASARWRPFYATAIYTGMRRGELCGLRKQDVDLEAGLIYVRRSWNRTPKGGAEAVIPVHPDLAPHLRQALEDSPSELVFPRTDGQMHRPDSMNLIRDLGAVMRRAGIVEGWTMVCRRKGCGFKVEEPEQRHDPCPECGFRLWPVAKPRRLRFHDLRHTAATLMLQAGAPLPAVQEILRHTDPKLTRQIYGHLEQEHLRQAITSIKLAPDAAQALQSGTKKPPLRVVDGGES